MFYYRQFSAGIKMTFSVFCSAWANHVLYLLGTYLGISGWKNRKITNFFVTYLPARATSSIDISEIHRVYVQL